MSTWLINLESWTPATRTIITTSEMKPIKHETVSVSIFYTTKVEHETT